MSTRRSTLSKSRATKLSPLACRCPSPRRSCVVRGSLSRRTLSANPLQAIRSTVHHPSSCVPLCTDHCLLLNVPERRLTNLIRYHFGAIAPFDFQLQGWFALQLLVNL